MQEPSPAAEEPQSPQIIVADSPGKFEPKSENAEELCRKPLSVPVSDQRSNYVRSGSPISRRRRKTGKLKQFSGKMALVSKFIRIIKSLNPISKNLSA